MKRNQIYINYMSKQMDFRWGSYSQRTCVEQDTNAISNESRINQSHLVILFVRSSVEFAFICYINCLPGYTKYYFTKSEIPHDKNQLSIYNNIKGSICHKYSNIIAEQWAIFDLNKWANIANAVDKKTKTKSEISRKTKKEKNSFQIYQKERRSARKGI